MPHLLLVEDNPLDAQIAQIKLQAVGFEITLASSLLEAETCAMQLLDPASPPLTLLILLDIRMPDPSHPELASPLLAAALSGRMRRGELRPATMIALTSQVTAEVEEEALFAGCAHVLAKPLTNQQAAWLRGMADEPSFIAPCEQGHKLYQQKAEEILQLVRRASVPNVWSEADVHLILCGVTQYPPPDVLDVSRQSLLLLRLGGGTAARAHLRRCADQLAEPQRAILLAFLEGKQQRQMAALFPDYDRTTVFRHCKLLRKRIAGWLATL